MSHRVEQRQRGPARIVHADLVQVFDGGQAVGHNLTQVEPSRGRLWRPSSGHGTDTPATASTLRELGATRAPRSCHPGPCTPPRNRAPEELRRPSSHELITRLLYAPSATPSGLRSLAVRVGVIH
jgi:hypothetical protein